VIERVISSDMLGYVRVYRMMWRGNIGRCGEKVLSIAYDA